MKVETKVDLFTRIVILNDSGSMMEAQLASHVRHDVLFTVLDERYI